MLMLIEEQDSSPFQLADEQLAEVRRRRADRTSRLLTLEELGSPKTFPAPLLK
jgi:hypothetical protein